MTYQNQGQSQLDRAVIKAIQYIKNRQTVPVMFDVFASCGSCYGAKLETTAAVNALKRITATAHKADLTDIYGAVCATIEEHENTFVYLVSDFTPAAVQAILQWQAIDGLQDINYDIIGVNKPTNALVKGTRVLRYREGIVELLVEVENSGSTIQKRMLGASAEGKNSVQTVDDIAVELEPSRSAEYVLQLQIDSQNISDDFLPVEVTLNPPDPLIADDKYFLGLQIKRSPQQRVLISGSTNRQSFLVRKALEAISRAEFDNNIIIQLNQGPVLERTTLNNSDILICGQINEKLGQNIDEIENFLAKGGTAVFFVSRDMDLPTAKRMCDAGILAAEPAELIDNRHLLSRQWPSDNVFAYAGFDVETARTARTYNLDDIPLWSHFACRKGPETKCLWSIETGNSLVYTMAKGAGKSLLINTSIDDSMSSLVKRAVVIPLCRLILGCGSVAYGYGFSAGEEITLPVFDFEWDLIRANQGIWVIDPVGKRHKVSITGPSLTGHYPEQTGWLRTLSKPVRYAGINPVVGETDLQICEQTEIDRLLTGLNSGEKQQNRIEKATTSDSQKRPLWRFLAWIIIMLLLTEGLVANRIKK